MILLPIYWECHFWVYGFKELVFSSTQIINERIRKIESIILCCIVVLTYVISHIIYLFGIQILLYFKLASQERKKTISAKSLNDWSRDHFQVLLHIHLSLFQTPKSYLPGPFFWRIVLLWNIGFKFQVF